MDVMKIQSMPRTRAGLLKFIDSLELVRQNGSQAENLPYRKLLRLEDTCEGIPKVFTPEDFPEVTGRGQEVQTSRSENTPSYPEWAAREANKASYLYRSGMPPKKIYDESRMNRFLYQIRLCGHPFSANGDARTNRVIFGAWRNHETGYTVPLENTALSGIYQRIKAAVTRGIKPMYTRNLIPQIGLWRALFCGRRKWEQDMATNDGHGINGEKSIKIAGVPATVLSYSPMQYATIWNKNSSHVIFPLAMRQLDELGSNPIALAEKRMAFKKILWRIAHAHPIQRGHASVLRTLPGIFHGMTGEVMRLSSNVDLLALSEPYSSRFAKDSSVTINRI